MYVIWQFGMFFFYCLPIWLSQSELENSYNVHLNYRTSGLVISITYKYISTLPLARHTRHDSRQDTSHDNKYSRTSVARTLMARLPPLFQTGS